MAPGASELPPVQPGITVRLHGGDTFSHADLSAWTRWARQRDVRIEADGHAHSLDDPLVWARLEGAAPNRVRLSLCSVRPEELEAWTGDAALARKTFDALERLCALEVDAVCVFPVTPTTASALVPLALELHRRFEGRVPLVLRRTAVGLGDELGPLGVALTALREALPADARLSFDGLDSYAPCLVPQSGWRAGLFPRPARPGERSSHDYPDWTRCGQCHLQADCTFRTDRAASALAARVAPLDAAAARAFESLMGDPQVGPYARQMVEGQADLDEGRLNAACLQFMQVARGPQSLPAARTAQGRVAEIEARLRAELRAHVEALERASTARGWLDLCAFVEANLQTPIAEVGIEALRRAARALPGREHALSAPTEPVAPETILAGGLRVAPTPDDTGLAAPLLGPGAKAFAAALVRSGASAERLVACASRFAEARGGLSEPEAPLDERARERLWRALEGEAAGDAALGRWLAAIAARCLCAADLDAAGRFVANAGLHLRVFTAAQ